MRFPSPLSGSSYTLLILIFIYQPSLLEIPGYTAPFFMRNITCDRQSYIRRHFNAISTARGNKQFFQPFMMGRDGERLFAKTICSSRAEQLEQDLLFALFGTV